MGAGGAGTPTRNPGDAPTLDPYIPGTPGQGSGIPQANGSAGLNALGGSIPPPLIYGVDTRALGQFMNSQAGSAYASMYDPSASYQTLNGDTSAIYNTNGTNVTGLMTAFQAWQTNMQQTKSNWDNYSDAVNANKGGEGDNTITSGAAVGQRQQLLGSLANAGNTTPTPGVGAMGMVQKKLGSIK